MSVNKPIGVGLIGYGMAGRVFHAPLIAAVPGLELTAIVQRSGDSARERYPAASIVRDVDALLADDRISLVVVATPTSSHHDLAARALEAGRHVVVDKPFTVTSEEGRELIELAGKKKRVLSVFHNRRWDADFLTVQRMLSGDALPLGRLVSFESRFDRYRNAPRPSAWRESTQPGSGVLYDLGSHLIDQALVLFGVPDRVVASVRRERDFGESDDAFDLWLEYSGFRATLHAGMLVRERTPRFVVRGTEATFIKNGLDPQEEALAAGHSPSESGWGGEARERWGTMMTDEGEFEIESLPGDYRAFYANVRDAINGEAQLIVTAEQAMAVVEIIESAHGEWKG